MDKKVQLLRNQLADLLECYCSKHGRLNSASSWRYKIDQQMSTGMRRDDVQVSLSKGIGDLIKWFHCMTQEINNFVDKNWCTSKDSNAHEHKHFEVLCRIRMQRCWCWQIWEWFWMDSKRKRLRENYMMEQQLEGYLDKRVQKQQPVCTYPAHTRTLFFIYIGQSFLRRV